MQFNETYAESIIKDLNLSNDSNLVKDVSSCIDSSIVKLWECESNLSELIIRVLASKHKSNNDHKLNLFFDDLQNDVEEILDLRIKDKDFKNSCNELIKLGSLQRLEFSENKKIKYSYRLNNKFINDICLEITEKLKTLNNNNNQS